MLFRLKSHPLHYTSALGKICQISFCQFGGSGRHFCTPANVMICKKCLRRIVNIHYQYTLACFLRIKLMFKSKGIVIHPVQIFLQMVFLQKAGFPSRRPRLGGRKSGIAKVFCLLCPIQFSFQIRIH